MTWNNPMSIERVHEAMVPFGWGRRVLDLGCGRGELLVAIGDGLQEGVGVDIGEPLVADARAAAGDLPLRFVLGDAKAVTPPGPFDRVVILGSSHAFGAGADALPAALSFASTRLAPDGLVVVGELFRRGELPAPYRALLGEPHGLDRTHADNVFACEAAGFGCVHAVTASEAEWDAFEWANHRARRRKEWRDAWLRWGRGVMGFGLYVLGRG